MTGRIVKDKNKKEWIMSRKISEGGFGEIYYGAAKDDPELFDYVIKVECFESDTLFNEELCLKKICNPSLMSSFMKAKNLYHLGIPELFGYGSFIHCHTKYRFIVVERLEIDLFDILQQQESGLSLQSVCTICINLLYVFEYLHKIGYIYRDSKPENVMIGRKRHNNKVYMIDYGLVSKYIAEPEADSTSCLDECNVGTLSYMSIDAHYGILSRRSDIESLLYTAIYLMNGHLPWSDTLNKKTVLHQKERFMQNIPASLNAVFQNGYPVQLSAMFHLIQDLEIYQQPDYDFIRRLFKDILAETGFKRRILMLEDIRVIEKKTKKKTTRHQFLSSSESD